MADTPTEILAEISAQLGDLPERLQAVMAATGGESSALLPAADHPGSFVMPEPAEGFGGAGDDGGSAELADLGGKLSRFMTGTTGPAPGPDFSALGQQLGTTITQEPFVPETGPGPDQTETDIRGSELGERMQQWHADTPSPWPEHTAAAIAQPDDWPELGEKMQQWHADTPAPWPESEHPPDERDGSNGFDWPQSPRSPSGDGAGLYPHSHEPSANGTPSSQHWPGHYGDDSQYPAVRAGGSGDQAGTLEEIRDLLEEIRDGLQERGGGGAYSPEVHGGSFLSAGDPDTQHFAGGASPSEPHSGLNGLVSGYGFGHGSGDEGALSKGIFQKIEIRRSR